jgi:hypothetical protein
MVGNRLRLPQYRGPMNNFAQQTWLPRLRLTV